MQDIKYIVKDGCAEPYKAIVHGRKLYRRCNEKLSQFEARAYHYQARLKESVWY